MIAEFVPILMKTSNSTGVVGLSGGFLRLNFWPLPLSGVDRMRSTSTFHEATFTSSLAGASGVWLILRSYTLASMRFLLSKLAGPNGAIELDTPTYHH